MTDSNALQVPDGTKLEVRPKPIEQLLEHNGAFGEGRGGAHHAKVLSELARMIDAGIEHIEKRYDDWRLVDYSMRMFIDLDRPIRHADGTEDTTGKENPFRRAIVIPITYANLISRMVQEFAILTQRDPFIHYEGRDSRDHIRARIHEAAIRYDNEQSMVDLQVWQNLFDAERYGICAMHDGWHEEWGWVYLPGKISPQLAPMIPPHMRYLTEQRREWGLRKQYVRWDAINPRRLLLDPAVPSWNVQAMLFAGWWDEEVPWLDLKTAERPEGPYFNLKAARSQGSGHGDNDSLTQSMTSETTTGDEFAQMPRGNVYRLWTRIIPKEWGLSDIERPEIWWFEVWNKTVIIRAHPLIYQHGEIPLALGQLDPDMHAAFTPGMGEQIRGLQDLSDWMAASHATQVRRALNDEGIFDPSLINAKEMLQPKPGRWARLTPTGSRLLRRGILPIDAMYSQKKMTDITSHHMDLVQAYFSFAQRVSAAADTIQGMPLPTKRTLGEVEQVTGMGTMRIGTTAQLLDRMLYGPLARRAISLRQQLTSREQIVRITGRLKQQLGVESITVDPQHLVGEYDYIAHTPTMAVDPARQAAIWGQFLQVIAGAPQLLMPDPVTGKRLDVHAVVDEFMQAAGVRYLDSFYKQVGNAQMAGMDQIQQGVDSGRLVPMDQAV